MIPMVKRLVHALLWDELAARRWIRGLLLGLGASGIGFADQLAAAGCGPRTILLVKVVSAVAALVAGMVTAGERNPRVFQGPPPPAGQS